MSLKRTFLLVIGMFLLWAAGWPVVLHAGALAFQDARQQRIEIFRTPRRIVSLVPSMSEIIVALGAVDAIVGVTYHDTYPIELAQKPIVGGFASPEPAKMAALRPDAVFISDLHAGVAEYFKDKPVTVKARTAILMHN